MGDIRGTKNLILAFMKEVDLSGYNYKLYSDLFNRITDKDFESYMHDLLDKKETLRLVVPVDTVERITLENNVRVAKKYDIKFFERMIIRNHPNQPDHVTTNEFPILIVPCRRAAQLLTKKISIPSDNKSIDLTSGQVTGKSRSSRITMPELQIMYPIGLVKTAEEFLKTRGGDLGESVAMDKILYNNGEVSRSTLDRYSTGTVSAKTLKSYLRAACLVSTL